MSVKYEWDYLNCVDGNFCVLQVLSTSVVQIYGSVSDVSYMSYALCWYHGAVNLAISNLVAMETCIYFMSDRNPQLSVYDFVTIGKTKASGILYACTELVKDD